MPYTIPDVYGYERSASLNEFNVAMALIRMKIPFYFQYAPFGSDQLRGQFVVDFLLYPNQLQMPLEVYGEYWHSGQLGADDKIRLDILRREFGREPIIIWGNESETVEDAMSALSQHVGITV